MIFKSTWKGQIIIRNEETADIDDTQNIEEINKTYKTHFNFDDS